MGVELYILDRRTVPLDVGGSLHDVGVLRHAGKLTEQLGAPAVAEAPSPVAALVARPVEIPVLDPTALPSAAHLVLSWEPGRRSVTDMDWDFLPVLGYAVRDAGCGTYVLHYLTDGALLPVTAARAVETGLVRGDRLLRGRQPKIVACIGARLIVAGCAEAEVVLDDGNRATLTVRTSGELPPAGWFVGKHPGEVEVFAN